VVVELLRRGDRPLALCRHEETGPNRVLTVSVILFHVMAEQMDHPIYQVQLWIRQISPMIWRRIRVRRESTLAQLHDIIQIVFGWSDEYLHRFLIHGRDYEVSRDGGPRFSRHARHVRLGDFQFRPNERFLDEYDFGDHWQH
jgi:hypothetical protein